MRAQDGDPHDAKVAVVTGAGSGVGRATVRALALRGYDVGLIARGEDALQAAHDEVTDRRGRAVTIPIDVSDADAVEHAVKVVETELGPIDVWINDAMTSVFSPVHEISAAEFERVTRVTYLGYVNGTLAVLPRMRARNRGVIVQVGSALAYRAIPLQAPYCAAKHAVRAFTDALRCELLHDHSRVRVVSVHLPAVNTPQFDVCLSRLSRRAQPVPPIYQPEVAADAIVYAAEHPRREVWVGGTTVATILANRVAPALLDRYLARTSYDAQQTNEAEHDRPSSLWEPVPGDRGAHGRFDNRSHRRSWQAWATTHRGVAAGATGVAAALAWSAAKKR